MRKNSIAGVALAIALGLAQFGCQDKQARQENEQLKARVTELEKENTDLNTRVDALAAENSSLAAENERLKAAAKPHPKKAAKGKHRKRAKPTPSNSN